MSIDFMLPPGRIVQGTPLRGYDRNRKGVEYVVKTGPNAGQKYKKFNMSVAYPKQWPADAAGQHAAAEFNAFYGSLLTEGKTGYPQFFGPDGALRNPSFSLKIIDGDGYDAEGKPNFEKEGFAGHWVVRFESNGIAPKLVYQGQYVTNEDFVKCGWYVRVFGNIKHNSGPSGPSESPGVYVTHTAVELIGAGKEITTGTNGVAVFAAAPVGYMPAGMSAVPLPSMSSSAGAGPAVLPAPQAMPSHAPGLGVQQPLTQSLAALATPTPPALGMAAQPNHAFVAAARGAVVAPVAGPGGIPALGAAPGLPALGGLPALAPLAPVVPQYQMTAAAGGTTREQAHAQGYSDEQLISAGYMVQV